MTSSGCLEKTQVTGVHRVFEPNRVNTKDGIEVIDVAGTIDISTAPRLRELLTALVSTNNYQLIINLERVEFLDSTGLGVLVGGLKRVRAHDGWIRTQAAQQRCGNASSCRYTCCQVEDMLDCIAELSIGLHPCDVPSLVSFPSPTGSVAKGSGHISGDSADCHTNQRG